MSIEQEVNSFILKVCKNINPYCDTFDEYLTAIQNKYMVNCRQYPAVELRLLWIWLARHDTIIQNIEVAKE